MCLSIIKVCVNTPRNPPPSPPPPGTIICLLTKTMHFIIFDQHCLFVFYFFFSILSILTHTKFDFFHFLKTSDVISWCLINIDNPQSYLGDESAPLRSHILVSSTLIVSPRYDLCVIFVDGGKSSILL